MGASFVSLSIAVLLGVPTLSLVFLGARWLTAKVLRVPTGRLRMGFGPIIQQRGALDIHMFPAWLSIEVETERVGFARALVVSMVGPLAAYLVPVGFGLLALMRLSAPVPVPIVAEVMPDGAAEAAGLRPRDHFVSVDGESIDASDDVLRVLARTHREEVACVVDRGGTPMSLSLPARPTPQIGVVFELRPSPTPSLGEALPYALALPFIRLAYRYEMATRTGPRMSTVTYLSIMEFVDGPADPRFHAALVDILSPAACLAALAALVPRFPFPLGEAIRWWRRRLGTRKS